MQKLSRRDALRGTGVAALAAGAAVIPLAAKASTLDEAEAMRLWQQFMSAEGAFLVVLRKYDTPVGQETPEQLEEIEAASDACCDVRLEITRLAITGPLGVAVKLAVTFTKESRDYAKLRPNDEQDLDLLDIVAL